MLEKMGRNERECAHKAPSIQIPLLRTPQTAVKHLAIALAIIMCGQTFCPQLQQTFAVIRSGLDSTAPDVNDSEVFFQAASRTLTFKLTCDDLSFIGADNKPMVEPGDFDIMVGNLADRLTLQDAPAQTPRRNQSGTRKVGEGRTSGKCV
jgi:hypothetical protein